MRNAGVPHVTLHGTDRTVACPPGVSVLAALREAGLMLEAGCGGEGRCGLCRVQFLDGAPEAHPEDRQICGDATEAGWRLACHAHPAADCRIAVPDTRAAAGLHIVTDAASRLASAAGSTASGATGYGVAVDVGTTTVACYLVRLADARPVDVAAFPNPQRAFGHDVVTRIMRAHRGPEHLRELQRELVAALEAHVLGMCETHAIPPEELGALVAVGNSTMMHLLWGVDPWPLGVAPYEPVFTTVPPRPGRELGFAQLGNAQVSLLPGIAGQLGSDTIAGLLALGPALRQGAALFLDLGTNGEIVLVHGDRALGCSCAAGPAFEGVHISCGMSAAPGAIDRVDVDDDGLRLRTLGDAPPQGLCGSGLTDAVAVLLGHGLLAPDGRLAAPDGVAATPAALTARLCEDDGVRAFVLHESADQRIALTQRDIREVQLAKGAVRTGVELLLQAAGLTASDVRQVFVGGAFGTALRPESVRALGLLPDAMDAPIRPVGNVAGLGAQLALLFEDRRREADQLAAWITHVPLAGQADFETRFAASLAFPAAAR